MAQQKPAYTGQKKRGLKEKLAYAKHLQSTATPSERRAAGYLKWCYKKKGWPYTQWQVVIAGYIVDALIREADLIIEIDGPIHDSEERRAADKERERHLRQLGYRIIRIRNEAISKCVTTAFREVKEYLLAYKAQDGLPVIRDSVHRPPLPEKVENKARRTKPPRRNERDDGKAWFQPRSRSVSLDLAPHDEEAEQTCKVCGSRYKSKSRTGFCTSDCTLAWYDTPRELRR